MIKVIIADDHPVVRAGLKQIIAETHDVVVEDEAASGAELLKKLSEMYYDVVLLDIAMPGMSGLDVLKQLQSLKPKPAVLVLSMHPEEQYAVRALRAGAAGYLTKVSAPGELIKAIRKISLGGKYVSETLAEKMAFDLDIDTERPLHESLSDREYQVLCMIGSGKTVKEIAAELYLSEKTISTYRSRILDKMKLKNNAELTRYVIENHLQ